MPAPTTGAATSGREARRERAARRSGPAQRPLLRPGRTCWRIEPARRFAVLLDAGPYFAAVHDALRQAERSVNILAWDVDSRLELRRGPYAPAAPDEWPEQLVPFLAALLARRPELSIHLLMWDCSVFYAFERELLPEWRLGWATPARLHFCLDASHPPGGSVHEKIVVIDDALAFAGGIDLGRGRWDTPDHHPADDDRTDPAGARYTPFHDVQVAVDGPVAAALGDHARERWARAAGERLPPPAARAGGAPWPAGLGADLEDVPVAIARTDRPPGGGRIAEIERLFLDAIRGAERAIYLETQFLTAESVVRALCARLRAPTGPAVVLVLPQKASGWIEETTIGLLGARALLRLQRADRHGRLGLYRPVAGEDASGRSVPIYVHSKVAVFDERLLAVGSPNLTNRSLAVDTESLLAVEAPPGDERVQAAVGRVRDRLLAHQLGVAPAAVREALARADGDLHAAVEALRRDTGRTLVPLEPSLPEDQRGLVPDFQLVDPLEPVDAEAIVGHFMPEEQRSPARRRALLLAGGLLLVAALAALWLLTPLREIISVDRIARWLERAASGPWAVPVTIAAFLVLGSVGFPVLALISMTALAFAPLPGFALAFGGSMAAAAISYGIGVAAGRAAVRRLLGRRAERLAGWLARRGLITMIAVRILPVAPFAFINVVAGATAVRFRDFMLGTVIGMTPGILAITILVDRVWAALRQPEPLTIAIAAAGLAVAVSAVVLVRRWLARRRAALAERAPR